MISEILIKLTRDSVCAGDDVDDHTKIICITTQRNTAETIMHIAKEYLPNVAGYSHTWDCVLNGTKCAVIKGNCVKITSIIDISLTEKNVLYFKYHSAKY